MTSKTLDTIKEWYKFLCEIKTGHLIFFCIIFLGFIWWVVFICTKMIKSGEMKIKETIEWFLGLVIGIPLIPMIRKILIKTNKLLNQTLEDKKNI